MTFYFEIEVYCYDFKIIYDDAFSTKTVFELVGITGPVRLLWMSGSPAKIRNKKD